MSPLTSCDAHGNIVKAWPQGFTKRYGLKRLVYTEWHDSVTGAIQREKNLKHWPRAWKVSLIRRDNPRWEDLYDGLR